MVYVRWIQPLNKSRTCYKWRMSSRVSIRWIKQQSTYALCARNTSDMVSIRPRQVQHQNKAHTLCGNAMCQTQSASNKVRFQTKHVLAIRDNTLDMVICQPSQVLEQSTYTFLLRKALDMITFSQYTKQHKHRVVGWQRTRYSQYTTSEISHMETYCLLA